MRIREAASHHDLDEVTRIQREVWDLQDIEIVGRIQLKASQHVGGSVLIAEADGAEIAGFAYAFPAHLASEVFWHSDMLAVRPRYRGARVGQTLKWAQREHALHSGIRRITWTFDPMQAGNAHLNLELLGVTVREYLADFYGLTTSKLHHGLPTDRLLASWDLESPRVLALSRGETAPPGSGQDRVPIPRGWNDLVAREPERARAEQRSIEEKFRANFLRGLMVTGFDKTSSAYVFAGEEGK